MRGSEWVLVGFADFNSVGPGPSVGAVGSTPSRSRHLCCHETGLPALRWSTALAAIARNTPARWDGPTPSDGDLRQSNCGVPSDEELRLS